ncbi:MAG TPA: thiamine pyrophosphate-dependent enzyme [Acetobacteraceae bacterium]|nr:thiamine pyrophosphate-dependent enzyme [Acetobacteraceae bacterium]
MAETRARKARGSGRMGGRILADALVAQGIDHVFSVPGESFLAVLDGFHDVRQRLKLVTCRFEAGATNMAEAFGKLRGRPAAAFVTRGPGACHGAIGVHTAMQDSTPLLLFVGQIPLEHAGREAFQEIDYRRMFGSLCKWVVQIDQAHRIPEIVAHAVDVATSGRPGPVVVALSEEMQRDLAEVADIPRAPVVPAYPAPAAIEQMMSMLARARRPLAVVGGSCWNEAGRRALRDFLHGHDIPVAVGFRRQAVYDNSLETFVGDLGVGADPALLARVKDADLILAIGSRLGDAVSQGYTLFQATGGTPIIQVHPDPAEIGRVFRPALGIVADLNEFAQAAAASEPVYASWDGWRGQLRALREAGREPPDYPGPLNLGQVMRSLEELLARDAIVTTDAGNFAGWATRFINFREHQRYIGPTSGAMGYSVPAAIGAKIAFPERMVVSLVGDGGFLMTGQEIATAFHHGVAPIVLVFNNAMYGTIRMHQERDFPGRVSGTALTNPDFVRFIEAFGGHGETVRATAAFAPAFRRAAASGKPAVIELRVNPDQITTRTTITALRARKPTIPAAAPLARAKSRRR